MRLKPETQKLVTLKSGLRRRIRTCMYEILQLEKYECRANPERDFFVTSLVYYALRFFIELTLLFDYCTVAEKAN